MNMNMNTTMSGMDMNTTMSGMNMNTTMSGMNMNTKMSGMNGGHDLVYFHLNTMAILLFKQINITTTKEMAIAGVVLFFISMFYEGLKTFRNIYLSKSIRNECTYTKGYRICRISHLIQTLLHGVQMFMSYSLMMVFMTFNGWLCGAIVLGAMMGYFLFSWKSNTAIDINEHCT